MGSMSADVEDRLVPGTLCACATILVYDLLCTLDQEISYVWPRPWSTSTALFVFNRYLPFVDVFISLTSKFTRQSPEQCLMRNVAVGWLSVLGIMLSEGILMLRTYALWERKPFVLVLLCIVAVTVFIPIIILVRVETISLHYIPTPDVGCQLSSASSILIYGYLMIMISETDLRRSHSWVLKLYQDGMLFYAYLLMISVANVLVPILGPRPLANWLATPQRVFHSILCTRVLFLILRQRRLVRTPETTTFALEETHSESGMVFSSIVEEDESRSGILYLYS
ncbi:hypothetical protein FB45DRAFT_356549 [Roridomyces roridus]|uniref:DUF6533 domain-containing protein n=1 Tax=Roridomyces roridus TaxID=1738132 RepID=A0AAD7C7T4_9AGAR|nr:hypothetical protein FB45DRAFT_356549 [Roridomyces roridus]